MKTSIAIALCTASFLAAAPTFANTSADTAPDRLPALTAIGTMPAAPSTWRQEFGVFEGGQAATPAIARSVEGTGRHASSRVAMVPLTGSFRSAATATGQPYADGAAN